MLSLIHIYLFADGEKIKSQTITESDGWRYVFDNLDKYKDGKVIEYTVTEDKVEGYTTEINGTDIVLSLIHI